MGFVFVITLTIQENHPETDEFPCASHNV